MSWKKGSRLFNDAFFDGQTEVVQEAGQLTIRPPAKADASHFAGYRTATAIDLSGAVATVGVKATSGGALTNYALVVDSETWYAFAATGDTLVFVSKEHGAVSSTNIPFDSSVHRYWRFRHDQAGNVLYWETRGSGGSWQVRHALTPGVSIASAEMELSAGTSRGVSDPGTAVFDAFRLEIPKH